MDLSFVTAAGGIGLFLLGMLLMTQGLRAFASGALRRILRRLTRSPLTGALGGALATALVQSSSATTVATVGFVGAGLITFPQALGIIFGANIGTTLTGWLVAIVGFKLQLGEALMPMLLAGVLIHLYGRGRWKDAGLAIAGFALLFVGLNALQEGMGAFAGAISPEDLPADTPFGRLQLVLIGLAVTLVTQSSSAGVAIALAALGVGAVSFAQAAALVIGMDVGTSVTAALAAAGGSTATRRTGLAHVVLNVLTAIMAFALLGPLTRAIHDWAGIADLQIGLVAFHTAFNVIGVAAVIGFTHRFAGLVVWLVPHRGPAMTARLDERLLVDPPAAIDAAAGAIGDIAHESFALLADQLRGRNRAGWDNRLGDIAQAEDETRRFAERVTSHPGRTAVHRRHMAVVHTLDHLIRLAHRCRQTGRIETIAGEAALRPFALALAEELGTIAANEDAAGAEARIDALRRRLRDERQSYRETTIEAAARGEIETEAAMLRLDSIRWLHRVAYHVWRITHHLALAASDAPGAAPAPETAAEAGED